MGGGREAEKCQGGSGQGWGPLLVTQWECTLCVALRRVEGEEEERKAETIKSSISFSFSFFPILTALLQYN